MQNNYDRRNYFENSISCVLYNLIVDVCYKGLEKIHIFGIIIFCHCINITKAIILVFDGSHIFKVKTNRQWEKYFHLLPSYLCFKCIFNCINTVHKQICFQKLKKTPARIHFASVATCRSPYVYEESRSRNSSGVPMTPDPGSHNKV